MRNERERDRCAVECYNTVKQIKPLWRDKIYFRTKTSYFFLSSSHALVVVRVVVVFMMDT